MREHQSVAGQAGRLRTVLRWMGGGYLVYHALVVSVLVVLFFVDTRPGYWREPGVVAGLTLTVLLYPLAIPALVVCGGPHNCGGIPLTLVRCRSCCLR
jgi:hypothetical protein